jgi:hypothetical protein
MSELIKALEAVDKTFGHTYPWAAYTIIKQSTAPDSDGEALHHALIGYRAGKAYATETLRLHEAYAEVAVLQDALGCFDVDYDLEPGEEVSIQLTYEDQVKLRRLSPILVDPTSIAQPAPNNPDSAFYKTLLEDSGNAVEVLSDRVNKLKEALQGALKLALEERDYATANYLREALNQEAGHE